MDENSEKEKGPAEPLYDAVTRFLVTTHPFACLYEAEYFENTFLLFLPFTEKWDMDCDVCISLLPNQIKKETDDTQK